MKSTKLATTVPAGKTHPLVVDVIGPDGRLVRSVWCQDRTQAMEVIEDEALGAPTWTILRLRRRAGKHSLETLDRWAVGPRGLSRAPRRRK